MASSERPTTKIVVSVVSTLIGAAVIYFASSWWSPVQKALSWVFLATWHFLVSTRSIPGWLLLIFCLATLVCLFQFIAAARRPTGPNWRQYTQDLFFDIMWRWSYFGGEIQRPVPFCRHCDIQLVPQLDTEYGPWGRREVTHFICDHCHRTRIKLDEPLEHIENKVIRQVHRKLRNNEWIKSIPNSTNDA